MSGDPNAAVLLRVSPDGSTNGMLFAPTGAFALGSAPVTATTAGRGGLRATRVPDNDPRVQEIASKWTCGASGHK